MKPIIFIMLVYCLGCKSELKPTTKSDTNSQEKITEISFHLEHSLRIPNYKVDIEMNKRFDGIFIHVASSPMIGNEGWDSTRIDTTYKIDTALFNHVLSSIRKISSKDLESSGVSGDDGTSCEIKFGDSQNYISYVIWTPNYDSPKRRTEDFLNACEQFIIAAKLNPKDIL